MQISKLITALLLGALLPQALLAGESEDCKFDAEAADSPAFASKIIECETRREKAAKVEIKPGVKADVPIIKLYGAGSKTDDSGISERVVVAPGSLNHTPGASYAAREAYSLRPDAKFEESVTLAIHRLHLQMAHYCSDGWQKTREWVEPNPAREGEYFLHFGFRCAE